MNIIKTDQDNITILTELYCEINEFMNTFSCVLDKYLIGTRHQRPFSRMSTSEIMTILIGFQMIGGHNFKEYYKDTVLQFHRCEFPTIVSYNRFVELSKAVIVPLMMFLKFRMEMSEHTMIYVIDSTPLRVCINLRIARHKVFKNLAERGKTSTGWFFGFKLHLVINHIGELMAVNITAGNTDDRKPLKELVKSLKGVLLGDKGYISSQIVEELIEQGLEFITTLKKNMKKKDMSFINRILLRKRAVVESVNDMLKNFFTIEHSRHRSVTGLINCVFTALIAYTFYPSKPKMRGIEIEKSIVAI